MFQRKWVLAVGIVLALFLFLLIGISAKNSAIFEENNHLSAGYYFFKTNDYRMGPGHPPLTYKILALPLLFSKAQFPFENEYCRQFFYYACANEFLYNSGIDAARFIFLGRISFILLAVLTGFFVFKWAKELYGTKAGLLSLVLYVSSPVVLAWAPMSVTDFPVTAFCFLSIYFFWKLLKKPGRSSLLLTGLFFGLAQASKFTALILIPVLIVVGFFSLKNRQPAIPIKKILLGALAIVGIGFFVLWSAYGFSVGTYSSGAPARYTEIVYAHLPQNQLVSNTAHFFIEKAPLPFPSYFVGLSEQLFISSSGLKPSFFAGSYHPGGIWYFHIVEFFLKVPLAFLALLIISLVTLLLNKKTYQNDVLFLLMPAFLFFLAFITVIKINSGVQHILPVFPFLFVFMGRTALLKKLGLLVFLLAFWCVAASLFAFPHYISYFNELVKDGTGYTYFIGSNVDQGQDLLGLANYVHSRNLGTIKLSYFGTTDPKSYLSYDYLPSPFILPWVPVYASSENELPANYSEHCGLSQGIVAISVTNLQGAFLLNQSCYSWLDAYKPIAHVGNSIFIYNVTQIQASGENNG
jgi:hypothetical protein